MTAVVSTTCARCGAYLTDRTSRLIGYGPECRKEMSAAKLRAAVARNTPGHIPAERPATRRARATNAAARRAAQPVAGRELCPCDSGAVKGRCPTCRIPADSTDVLAAGVARIIARIRAERDAARDAAYEAWHATHTTKQPTITEETDDRTND